MPILDIEILSDTPTEFECSLAQTIAKVCGEIFSTAPGNTWVKIRFIPRQHYAESGGIAAGVDPVFVHVLKRAIPPKEELQSEIDRLTEAIAKICRRSEANIHILYQPGAAGRVAFGGKLVGS